MSGRPQLSPAIVKYRQDELFKLMREIQNKARELAALRHYRKKLYDKIRRRQGGKTFVVVAQ